MLTPVAPVAAVGACIVLLIGVGLVLTAPVSERLAKARWPRRSPRPALVLWQAVCLAAGFSVVAGLVVLAVEPLGDGERERALPRCRRTENGDGFHNRRTKT